MKLHNISAFYLDKQKSFVPKKKCSMLVIKILKCKISDFLNSNTCFCSQLYGRLQKLFLNEILTFGSLCIRLALKIGVKPLTAIHLSTFRMSNSIGPETISPTLWKRIDVSWSLTMATYTFHHWKKSIG